MDITLILAELEKLEEALKCHICSKKCVEPVRVKVCGHYFCVKCLKKREPRFCPKCKRNYELCELDYDNIAKETENILSDMKRCLQPDANELKSFAEDNLDLEKSPVESSNKSQKDVFEYCSKKYHINYIDELHSKINAKGETPLHIACKKKRLEEAEQLIKKKVDLNVKDFAGWTPLHEAAESGSIQIAEALLKHGTLIDVPGEEYVTPLHKAVMRENEQLIRLLLKYGADLEVIDYSGRKPVDYTLNPKIKSVLSEPVKCVGRVEEIFCMKKICVYYYYIEESYKEKLNKCKLAKVVNEFDAKKVTHFIIRKTHKLSVKMLVAMLEGCFLVPQEWIDAFLEGQYFIPIPEYTFISSAQLNEGLRKAIINSLLKRPKLFDGISFFIQGHSRPVEIHDMKCNKNAISSLIHAGGGKVLHRAPTPTSCVESVNFPYHSHGLRCCHYIIYEEQNPPTLQYQMAEIKHKSSTWLLDCIINLTVSD